MRTFFKWLLRTALAVVALVIVGALVLYVALTSTLPADNGGASIAGLSGEVQVLRDGHGVPHVEAANYDDAARALGFVHAQDRFWQMHVMRRVAQGRLSELFGAPTVDTDIFLRTMDLEGAARASYEVLSPQAKGILKAYSDGVNAWLERPRGLLEAQLPPEFMILQQAAEPWEPWQSVAMVKVMALTLDSNLDDEIKRLALAARGMSPGEIDDMMPYSPRDTPPPLPDLRDLFDFAAPSLPKAAMDMDAMGRDYARALAWDTPITASNNWAVSGSRSVSGKPLLANDPHLGLTAPTVFYLVHLAFTHDGRHHDIVGGSLPGTPLVLTGRTGSLSWGLTTTNLDGQDLFVERLNPEDPTQYLTPTGWANFETEKVTIRVSGADPVAFERRRTRHGPVLPDGYRGLKDILPPGHVGALSWVSLAHDDTTAEAAIGLGLSQTVSEAMEAARKMVAPMQSIVMADASGAIGLIAPGRVPVRDPSNMIMGREPVPGWLAQYDWKGWLSFEDLPRIDNPASGALATANANWMPPGYSHHITFDWDERFRQERVETLVIDATEKHSLATMRAIQTDNFSPALTQFRDTAIQQLVAGTGQDRTMIEALADWDGLMSPGKPEPLIMTAWWRHTQIAIFEDDLGPDYKRFAKGNMEPVLMALRTAGTRDWCDDRRTARAETCGAILSRSLSAALDELKAAQGDDWRSWRWGAAHLAFGEHRPFSSVKPLSWLFTVSRPSAGGSYTLLRGRTDFSGEHPYFNIHASAFRAYYDMADPQSARFVTSTGQSGHFLSPHYSDLADLWAGLDYIAIPTETARYRKEAKGVWRLTPAQ